MKTINKKTIFWYIFIIFFISSSFIFFSNENQNEKIKTVEENSFSFPMPIKIGGYIFQENKYSELNLSITNNTKHIISAVRFFVECYDVYGENMGVDKNYIYQEKCIESGKYRKATCIIPKNTKRVKIYTYSVYYKNNYVSEWGSRELTKKEIKIYAPLICIDYAY